MAFGKRGYYFMAYNLAFSIKNKSDRYPVHLITDDIEKMRQLIGWKMEYFDIITQIDKGDIYNNGKFDPGFAKVSIYKYLQFDNNLYLDVDAIAVKPIDPLIEELVASKKNYASQVVGYHTIDKGDYFAEMQWAKAGVIWNHFELAKDAILPAINSSVAFIRKSKEAEKLYKTALEFYLNPIPLKELTQKWGGTQPDELYMNSALAKCGIDPNMESMPIHFATHRGLTFDEVIEQFYFQGYYGGRGFTAKFYTDWVDSILLKEHKKKGENHHYTMSLILDDKHANKR